LIYTNARNFSEGLAAVKQEKWGFINAKGEIIIPAQYDEAYMFQNGMAGVWKDGKAFYIDSKGKFVKEMPVRFESVEKRKEKHEYEKK
jgi:hypothetical protein